MEFPKKVCIFPCFCLFFLPCYFFLPFFPLPFFPLPLFPLPFFPDTSWSMALPTFGMPWSLTYFLFVSTAHSCTYPYWRFHSLDKRSSSANNLHCGTEPICRICPRYRGSCNFGGSLSGGEYHGQHSQHFQVCRYISGFPCGDKSANNLKL